MFFTDIFFSWYINTSRCCGKTCFWVLHDMTSSAFPPTYLVVLVNPLESFKIPVDWWTWHTFGIIHSLLPTFEWECTSKSHSFSSSDFPFSQCDHHSPEGFHSVHDTGKLCQSLAWNDLQHVHFFLFVPVAADHHDHLLHQDLLWDLQTTEKEHL